MVTRERVMFFSIAFWSEWSEWGCAQKCGTGRMIRTRTCESLDTGSCPGEDKEYKEEPCTLRK